MVHFLTSFTALALALFTAQATAQASNNDPNGKHFYISSPSCDYYQCQVKKHVGDKMVINWLNPLSGDININFVPNGKGTSYRIATKLAANYKHTTCDKGGQKTCGAYTWLIPSTVKSGEYSVEIHSLTNKRLYAYTDIVKISRASNSSTS